MPQHEPLPVTGAWMPGDPVGHRKFFTIPAERPVALDGGALLRGVTIAYQTWGQLDAARSNAVLVWTHGPVTPTPKDLRWRGSQRSVGGTG